MPTASKIVAAICFALFGVIAAETFKSAMPDGTQFGYFLPITALIGLSNGWWVMGRLTGYGYRSAMGSGIRTAITIAVWAVLVFSIYEMVLRSMNVNRYDGPMEAIVAAFGLMLDYGKLIVFHSAEASLAMKENDISFAAVVGWLFKLLLLALGSPTLWVILIGGAIGGAITEWAGKRWS